MRILLTNDDGYRAIGINSLFKLLLSYGHDVIIIAPEMNSSGYSQSISVYTPVKIHQVSERVYFVSSTPADSVRLGLQIVYGDTNNYPDLIISGINLGENIGEDVLYSGTVGAAREGLIHNIPSLAVSTNGAPDFVYMDDVAIVVLDLINRFHNNKEALNEAFMWNINIPHKKYTNIEYEATKLGHRLAHEPFEKQITPRGEEVYWQGKAGAIYQPKIGTDLAVFIKQEKVSITPLEIYSTNYNQMPIIAAITG